MTQDWRARLAEASGLLAAATIALACWGLGEGRAVGLVMYQGLGVAAVALLIVRCWRPGGLPAGHGTVRVFSVLLVVLAAASVLTSANRGLSVQTTVVLAAGVSLMHSSLCVSRSSAARLVALQSIVVLPIAVSAVLEPLGVGWLPSHDYFPGRAMGNMGGPGPLGALLAMVVPVAAAFFMTSSKRATSFLWGGACVLLIAAVTATFSRAAILATTAGVAVALFVLLRSLPKQALTGGENEGAHRRRRVLLRAAVVVAMAVLVVPLYNGLVVRAAPAEYEAGTRPGTRTFETVRRIEGSDLTNAQVRLLCWRTAAGMVATRPLVGVGAGCFGVAAEGILPDGLQRIAASRGIVYRYAYNDYLQIAGELGVPALLVFLVVLGAAFVSAGRASVRPGRHGALPAMGLAALAGSTGALAAVVSQAAIDFPLHLPTHQALFWVNVGLLSVLSGPTSERPSEDVRGGSVGSGRRRLLRVVAVIIAIASVTVRVTVATRMALAAGSAVTVSELRESGDLIGALDHAERAVASAPHEHTYWILLGETAHEAAAAGVDRRHPLDDQRTLALVFNAYREAEKVYPYHAPTYGRAGALYLAHAGTLPGAVDSAKVHLKRAIDLNPYFADPHTNLGTVLMMEGDHDGARAELTLASALDTLAAAPLFNLGNLAMEARRPGEAESSYRSALRRDPGHVGTLTNLSILLIRDGRSAEAERHLRTALNADPLAEPARSLLLSLDATGR